MQTTFIRPANIISHRGLTGSTASTGCERSPFVCEAEYAGRREGLPLASSSVHRPYRAVCHRPAVSIRGTEYKKSIDDQRQASLGLCRRDPPPEAKGRTWGAVLSAATAGAATSVFICFRLAIPSMCAIVGLSWLSARCLFQRPGLGSPCRVEV